MEFLLLVLLLLLGLSCLFSLQIPGLSFSLLLKSVIYLFVAASVMITNTILFSNISFDWSLCSFICLFRQATDSICCPLIFPVYLVLRSRSSNKRQGILLMGICDSGKTLMFSRVSIHSWQTKQLLECISVMLMMEVVVVVMVITKSG